MDTNTQVGRSAPRDVFLYLLGLVTLVMSAGSFGALIYSYIDIKFPDVLRYGASLASANYSLIRSALAVLIVAFPVFFWASRVLHKDVVNEPAKRDIRVRRWLLYFTVFVAGLVIIGDLITLIQSFLNGDLTTPFILKVLTVFFIAGSVLFYYLSELRDRAYPRMVFQAIIVGIVVLSLGYGFYLAGSPQNQRLVRFDEQKVSDLQNIQSYLVYSWYQQKGSLPKTLEQLNDPISSFMVPVDPQGQKYEYLLIGPHSFQLCATFNGDTTEKSVTAPNASPYDNWQHGVGRICFDRNIDQALYPVNQKGQ
ncbi:MAG: hypothetical protein KBC81_03160 [Candidatus Pacebacteria bacterium]|nr:hypothetical protein [Candidatus Paceibacterota bacterium]